MPRFALALPFATLIAAVFAAACDDGGGPARGTPSPAVTAVPSPTPSPTPAADPTRAADLRYRGDYAAAAAEWAAVAAARTGEARLDALFAQAQAHELDEDPAAARAALEGALAEAGPGADGSLPQFLLASVLDTLDEDAAALDLYSRYVSGGGILTPWANAERAPLLAALARAPEAESVAAAVVADPLLAAQQPAFTLGVARAYATAGLSADALAWFARAQAYEGVAAFALAGAGALRQTAGDPAWTVDYLAAISAAPAGPDAARLLDELTVAGVPLSDELRGFVEYRAGRNDAARASLERAVAAGDRPGEALYYLGALDERAGDDDAAIERYRQSYETDPASPQADSALWWRARLLESARRFDDAIAVYGILADAYPASDWHAEATFRLGLCHFKAGRPAEAAAAWGAQAAGTDSDAFRARLWQAKALIDADDAAGTAALRALATDPAASGDYYALRAAELAGLDAPRGDAPLEALSPDWLAIDNAILPAATPAPGATAFPPPPVSPLQDDPRWRIAGALAAVGFHNTAASLHAGLLDDIADPRDGLAVTRRFFESGEQTYTARAAATLLSILPPGIAPPDDLRRLAYPPAFAAIVSEVSAAEDLDPLLLLALMRQESLYDPLAGSIAGALGLTQIIPPTADAIAADLGVTGFETRDLFRPAVNLRFGAHFLAAQLASFDGNIRHAAAAYNGGPGAALDARELAGLDDDLFVEELEFDETRLYVRRVLEHYAHYRALYRNP